MHILHLGTLRDIIASVMVDMLQSKALHKLLGACTMATGVSICWSPVIQIFCLSFPGIQGLCDMLLFSQPVNSDMLLRFYDLPVNADIDQVLHRFTYCAKEWAHNHHQDRPFIGFRA